MSRASRDVAAPRHSNVEREVQILPHGPNTLNSREHYELMEQFENNCKPGRLDKEPKALWAKGVIYQDGQVNALFLAYRSGCAYGRATPHGSIP